MKRFVFFYAFILSLILVFSICIMDNLDKKKKEQSQKKDIENITNHFIENEYSIYRSERRMV